MKKEVKIGTVLVFLAFFGFLLMQFSKVFIYYDDFGYLSLSYGNTVPDVVGSTYTLPQLLTFIGKHYLYSSGRLFYLFLFSFLNMLGGLTLVRVFMAVSVIVILILAFLAVTKHVEVTGWRPVFLAAFICLMYGTIGIMIQRLGTYWFAASFLYVVPTVVFFGLSFLYYKTVEEEPGKWRITGCLVLSFLGAFSQEEWLVAVIGFICMVIGYKLYKRVKVRAYDYAVLGAAVVGALPILTSPAVKMRMDNNLAFSQLPLLEKVIINVNHIVGLFFSGDNQNYTAVFLMLMLALGVYLIVQDKKFRVFHIAYTASTVLLAGYLFLKLKRNYFGGQGYSKAAIAVLCLYLIATLIQMLYMLWEKDCILLAMIFLSAILTLACLVVVPEIPQRVILPFHFLSYSVLGYLFSLIILNRKSLLWGAAALVILSGLSIPNLRNIYRGYKVNDSVLMYNDGVIRDNVRRMEQGEKIEKINLYRNPDPLCSNEMVYDENFKYMIYWMDEYYHLSPDVELIYETITDLSSFTK